MFTALHPLLLWGATAVAVPILIHLLLRQRPKPRPWAAMRWLLAAAQAAQRKYRLTNLLLLLLRCLIVLLIALAIARLALPGFGGGDRLVLVVDRSASMGARGSDPGPLAMAKAMLSQAELDYRKIVLVGVADDVQQFGEGTPSDLRTALGRLDVSSLPGGLERASSGKLSEALTGFVGSGADVVLISDFQQDDASQLVALLQPRCRTIKRLAVGNTSSNALVTDIGSLSDLRPEQAGELVLRVSGDVTGVELGVDDAAFLPLNNVQSQNGVLSVPLPPLPAGAHTLRVRLGDQGLVYDNLLELPVQVRADVPLLVVRDETDYLIAALKADNSAWDAHEIQAPALTSEPLPVQGLLVLRVPVVDGGRIAKWVKAGGALWATLPALEADAELRALISDLARKEGMRAGGNYRTGEADIDEILGIGKRQSVPDFTLPGDAVPVLWAGDAPLIAQIPVGNGTVVVELADLAPEGDEKESLRARGTFPLWASRYARRVTAELAMPKVWQAGQPAPITTTLQRNARSVTIEAGDQILLEPGVWTRADESPIVVVPSRTEGVLQQAAPRGAVTMLQEALPERPGSDWSLWLAIAALLVAITEGLFAAWAGRAYGARQPAGVPQQAVGRAA